MAIKSLDDNEPKLKNALPQQIFTKTALEPGVLKSVVDEINKIDPQKFNDHDLIGRVYESFFTGFLNQRRQRGRGILHSAFYRRAYRVPYRTF